MAETKDQYRISQTWTNLNDLTSTAIGTDLILQNIGYPGDNISVAITSDQPSDDFRGILLNQINPMTLVSGYNRPVWVRYYRFDNVDKYPQRTGFLQVQLASNPIVPFIATKHPNESEDFVPLSEETFVIAANRLFYAMSGIQEQLKLLNHRIEEGFQTRINLEDVKHEY